MRTKITFLIDTVPPNAKDAETRGHDPLPPSPLMKKLQLMAEEVANYKSILCQATNCWMPNAECDSSHLLYVEAIVVVYGCMEPVASLT